MAATQTVDQLNETQVCLRFFFMAYTIWTLISAPGTRSNQLCNKL